MIFSSKWPENMVFPKKLRWNMIFLVYLERWYFFPGKYDIFSFDGQWMMIFLNKYMEIWYFLYICINVTNMILPICKKKSEVIFFRKNTLKADWHSRSHSKKSSNDSLYCYGDLHGHFHIFFSTEEKSGNLICRIEIWLLLQFTSLEIFHNEESSIFCTIQPSGVVTRGVLEHQLKKLFVH